MIMLLGSWWDLLLGRSEECDAALEAKSRTNNADAIVQCEEVTFELEGFNFSLDRGEGLIRLFIEIKSFLDVEGWMSFVSS